MSDIADGSVVLTGEGAPAAGRKKRRRKRKQKYPRGSGDFLLVVLVAILVVFGIIMVFSASYYTALNSEGTPYYYLIREVIFVIAASVVSLFLAVFDYHTLAKFSIPIYIVTVLLLAMTYVPGIGQSYNNAARWIGVGPVTILPGELAKLSCIIVCAWWLARKEENVLRPVKGLLPLILLMAVPVALVYFQPSTTTAATLLMIILCILIVAGIKLRYVAYVAIAGVAGVVIHMQQSSGGYRSSRITSFLDPFADEKGSGYQVVQGLYALASGGLKGLGIGQSVQKTLYLPDPQNDFILAIIGEETGYIGLLVLLALYLLLIWRCARIALRAPDTLGMLMASGITIMLALHVILNVMVVTSLFPPTGIALPFVSYGGTAMMLFLGSMGIMLNISRHEPREKLWNRKEKTADAA